MYKSFGKRLFDILATLVGGIFLLPIIIPIAIWIKFSSKGSLFYIQKRVGKDFKEFDLYKFRSMVIDADKKGPSVTSGDDPRITKVGAIIRRTKIDELPQLLNVLKGDMSLVGPRPLLVEYLPLYSEKQSRRHEVRPGITGWAQVNGRNAISWDEKFDLDVWYVDNQSIWLDIKILWMTVKKVIARDGISQSNHVTMDKFKGSL